MGKISLHKPNLVVRSDQFDAKKTFQAIFNLARDIRIHFQSIADAVNYLYGPRAYEIIIPLNSAKVGGSKIPGWVQLADDGAGSTGIYSYAFDNGNEEDLYITAHFGIVHTAGTDIDIDIHWAPADGTAGNVVWGLEYAWVNDEAAVGNTSTIEVTVAVPEVAEQFTESSIGTIDGSGMNKQSLLIGRLYRKAADGADTYGADAFAFFLDMHASKTII